MPMCYPQNFFREGPSKENERKMSIKKALSFITENRPDIQDVDFLFYPNVIQELASAYDAKEDYLAAIQVLRDLSNPQNEWDAAEIKQLSEIRQTWRSHIQALKTKSDQLTANSLETIAIHAGPASEDEKMIGMNWASAASCTVEQEEYEYTSRRR